MKTKTKTAFYISIAILFAFIGWMLVVALHEENLEYQRIIADYYDMTNETLILWNETLTEWIDCEAELFSIKYNTTEEGFYRFFE